MNIDKTNGLNSTNGEYTGSVATKRETEDGKKFEDFLSANNIALSPNDTGLLYNMMSIYDMPYGISGAIDLAHNIQNIQSSFSYDTLNISKEDALFFASALDENQEIVFTPANPQSFVTIINNLEETKATAEVSKTLLNLIEKAYNTSKPCRLDFDNNISVILQIDKDGKITANFLPSDAVAEQYLRSNIGYLRQVFDEQNIKYNELSYRNYKDNNDRQQKSDSGEEDE